MTRKRNYFSFNIVKWMHSVILLFSLEGVWFDYCEFFISSCAFFGTLVKEVHA